MGTNIRPEIAQHNAFYISKHRYYELKHFCMQYPEWKHERASIDGLLRRGDGNGRSSRNPDLTAAYAEARAHYTERIDLIDKTAEEATNDIFGKMLVKAITEEISYGIMIANGWINCSKELWYAAYRKFFWLLDKRRK